MKWLTNLIFVKEKKIDIEQGFRGRQKNLKAGRKIKSIKKKKSGMSLSKLCFPMNHTELTIEMLLIYV